MTLFDGPLGGVTSVPLAVRMRPRSVQELVGQHDALAAGSPLRSLLDGPASGPDVSVILWGPPGSGKTTVALLLSEARERRFVELSAVTAGVKDVRSVIDKAKHDLSMLGEKTVLFLDEVHRFSKSQQDALLPAVENGWVTLVAATTENPSFSVISPLLSRSIVVRLCELSNEDVRALVLRALEDPRGFEGEVEIDEGALSHLVRASRGDARRALTGLEAAAMAADPVSDSRRRIDSQNMENALQQAALRYDKSGDQHYDVISAFIKSVRGSDPDATLHYLTRMLDAGEDARVIARRLIILASEDIGLADSSVLQTAVAAAHAVSLVGMPEARIVLAHASLHAALAPKSNSVVRALDAATHDLRESDVGDVPMHLRDTHYASAKTFGHGVGYAYPHNETTGVAQATYLPQGIADHQYYHPTQHGSEAKWSEVAVTLRRLRSGQDPDSEAT